MSELTDVKTNGDDEPVEKKRKIENVVDGSLDKQKTESSSESTVERKPEIEKPDTERGILEEDAGITEYIGTHEGFSATIKQRYSDFIVNEIDSEGNIVHLTDMTLPPDDDDTEQVKTKIVEEKQESCEFISAEDWSKLQQLSDQDDTSAKVNIPAPADKGHRTTVHQSIKKRFPNLETKTVEEDDKKFIQAFFNKGKGRGRDFYYDNDWPKSKKDFRYVRFVLYKENKDTMDAIGLMAKNLRLKDSLFQYAGTKDRRGKTTQEITASRIHPKKLATLNKVLFNFGLGNFRYVKEPLKLGQMSGNHFTMVLRNVTADTETVDKALESLKANGFINYFGMQRFGTTTVPTHTVGRALLCGQWEEAVDLILMPRNDLPLKDKFQKIWAATKDAEKTLKATPLWCNIERNLLGGLVKQLSPFNAIEKIPRNMRMMYAHSYQAYVWNSIVSRRLREMGHAPVVGDLVMPQSQEPATQEKGTPIAVTEENVAEFTLRDVVLPLPGCKIIYPQNEVKGWYEKMLQDDNLDLNDMERRQKDYNMPGDYRHILGRANCLSWQHKVYDDYTEPLTLSDFDILKRKETLKETKEGKLKAVVLEMSLESSTYATMALREVLKIDTSSRHQATLNKNTPQKVVHSTDIL